MRPVSKNRRSFLRQCSKAAGALLVPAGITSDAEARASGLHFHTHPTYREHTALDSVNLKIPSEPYYEKLAPLFEKWSADLLRSPTDMHSLEQMFGDPFAGGHWKPLDNQPMREPGLGLSVQRIRFANDPALPAAAFLRDAQSAFNIFSKLLTADFQITRIESANGNLATTIRYEIVGTGDAFFREQRVGTWLFEWVDFRIVRWRMQDETRSRAAEGFYTDITAAAFRRAPSYDSQLSHGADYWRTILDGATGIDIYGHNGISVGDIDGDGYDDLYICQPAGLPNLLYRNRGDGSFEDITESSGLGLLENTACALFADFTNSGSQDLLVVRSGGPLLFLNQGNGKFSLRANAFLFAEPPQGTFTGASAADYNRDGFLDVYFCLYTYYQGTDQYRYPTPYFAAENGPPNYLMQNKGDGTFRDVTAQTGMGHNNTRYSFCCGWNDYNQDGWPDLYVVNDFGRKNLYRNNGDNTFTDVASSAGVEDVGAGMSISWFDYDNDGAEDPYVANMWTAAGERITSDKTFQEKASKDVKALYRKHAMGNSLFKGAGKTFIDTTASSHTGIGRWAWSSDAFDFDHDGFSDLYILNGMISGPLLEDLNSFFWREVVAKSPNIFQSDADYEMGWNAINELIRSDYSWSGRERNVFLMNNRDGTFSDISGVIGLDFLEDGRAFSLVDVDGDGRQEILIKNRDAPQLRLLKNTISELPPAIAFRLQGAKSNRDAIGANVTLHSSAGHQTKSLQAGSGFLSQHSKELFFGLGDAQGDISATVRWPSGALQELKNLEANHRVFVTEGVTNYKAEVFKAVAKPAAATAQPLEALPLSIGTWLLSPVLAPSVTPGQITLVCLRNSSTVPCRGANNMDVIVEDPQNQDIWAAYNLLFRYLFDRHRDLPVPTYFLLNEQREIVKVYQGLLNPQIVESDSKQIPRTEAERLAKALPFPGVSGTYDFGRNYLSLGAIFFQHGYPDYAETYFQSALKQAPTSAEAFYGLGSVYLKQGKNPLAQQNFESAVRLKPAYPETIPNAWNNLGLLATREGNTATAVGNFEQAIQVDPNHFISLENLGNAYKQQKRWPEARTCLERALSIKPNDAEANYSLGMVLAQLDDSAHAYEYLNRALTARPVYPEALNNLAILYLRTHRRDEAVATFERCMQVAPAFDQSYLNLARVYAIEGAPDKARTVLNALLSQHPDNALAKQALAQLP